MKNHQTCLFKPEINLNLIEFFRKKKLKNLNATKKFIYSRSPNLPYRYPLHFFRTRGL
jgi:hypothetical protein